MLLVTKYYLSTSAREKRLQCSRGRTEKGCNLVEGMMQCNWLWEITTLGSRICTGPTGDVVSLY